MPKKNKNKLSDEELEESENQKSFFENFKDHLSTWLEIFFHFLSIIIGR